MISANSMTYLDSVQAWLASLPEPHKGVILQSVTGEELRPFFGRTLLPSAEGATAGRGV